VASHGWNHESFPTFSLEEQRKLLKDTKDKIQQILAPYAPEVKVFIPPYNEIDLNTMLALEAEGI
jgi:peptidoglycan/xylan/chitin deacetylase (PgdA/CDA1 family)